MSYFREEGLCVGVGVKMNTPKPASWGEEDSNLRRRSQQIYSLPHLTALESPLKNVLI
jgi:hypothetical protein